MTDPRLEPGPAPSSEMIGCERCNVSMHAPGCLKDRAMLRCAPLRCAAAAKLVPVGFGIKKLQITCVIEDAKVESMDAIIEDDLVKWALHSHTPLPRCLFSFIVSPAVCSSPCALACACRLPLLHSGSHCAFSAILCMLQKPSHRNDIARCTSALTFKASQRCWLEYKFLFSSQQFMEAGVVDSSCGVQGWRVGVHPVCGCAGGTQSCFCMPILAI